MNKNITANIEQSLCVISSCGGYSCLGFDVLEHRYSRLASELVALNMYNCPAPALRGTVERYAQYETLVDLAREHAHKTGWKSKSELTPELIGLEGKRVEIRHQWKSGGDIETVRFIVGKSTGFIPCHLAIARRNSSGGPAVCLGIILGVRIVGR